MAGSTPHDAVEHFLDPIKDALRCVTDCHIKRYAPSHKADKPHIFTIGNGAPVPLGGDHEIDLAVTMHYRVVDAPGDAGPYRVTTAGYIFELSTRKNRALLIGYHWHPLDAKSPFKTPHLHLGKELRSEKLSHRAHLPTGRICLEDVLRMAINDFGVAPIRSDWSEVLARTQAKHEQYRTWGRIPSVE